MIRVPFVSLAIVLSVAACGRRDPVDDSAANTTTALPDVNVAAPSASGEPRSVETKPSTGAPAASLTIPAALQGRWGLTPADCMPGRADAKGLLTISASDLKFYESRAVPAGDAVAESDSVSGNFAYTGEGQSWTKYEALKVDKGRLTRTETKPMATFTYAKCS